MRSISSSTWSTPTTLAATEAPRENLRRWTGVLFVAQVMPGEERAAVAEWPGSATERAFTSAPMCHTAGGR
jgi:hypothetical protein